MSMMILNTFIQLQKNPPHTDLKLQEVGQKSVVSEYMSVSILKLKQTK